MLKVNPSERKLFGELTDWLSMNCEKFSSPASALSVVIDLLTEKGEAWLAQWEEGEE